MAKYMYCYVINVKNCLLMRDGYNISIDFALKDTKNVKK